MLGFAQKIQNILIVLLLFTLVLFSGCAAEIEGEVLLVEGLEALAIEEEVAILAFEEGTLLGMASAEGNAIRYAVAGEAIIANETVALSRLSRLRMATGNAFAYREMTAIAESGEEIAFARVLNKNTIQILKNNQIFTFPNGRIYSVIEKGVNIRSGCGLNYEVFAHVEKKQLVLVTEEIAGWYKVDLGGNKFGWISAMSLFPAFSEGQNDNSITLNQASLPNSVMISGNGNIGTKEHCSSCDGNGNIECSQCSGKGGFLCGRCDGERYLDCQYCSKTEQGSYVCSRCSSTGNYSCPNCKGMGYDNCHACNGMKQVMDLWGNYRPCTSCQSQGKYQCPTCDGQKYLHCNWCSGNKYFQCTNCSGNGEFYCPDCSGNGDIPCNVCKGIGKFVCRNCIGAGSI